MKAYLSSSLPLHAFPTSCTLALDPCSGEDVPSWVILVGHWTPDIRMRLMRSLHFEELAALPAGHLPELAIQDVVFIPQQNAPTSPPTWRKVQIIA